jgi:hypothetical protein
VGDHAVLPARTRTSATPRRAPPQHAAVAERGDVRDELGDGRAELTETFVNPVSVSSGYSSRRVRLDKRGDELD